MRTPAERPTDADAVTARLSRALASQTNNDMTEPVEERRQYPRVRLVAMPGAPAPRDARLTLRDLSSGGFSLESDTMFTKDETLAFAFSAGGHTPFIALATARHGLRINWPEGRTVYLCGFQFTGLTDDVRSAIEQLIDDLREGHRTVDLRIER